MLGKERERSIRRRSGTLGWVWEVCLWGERRWRRSGGSLYGNEQTTGKKALKLPFFNWTTN